MSNSWGRGVDESTPLVCLPPVGIKLLVVERQEFYLHGGKDPDVVLLDPQNTTSDHRLYATLPHKRRLVLCAARLYNVNLSWVRVVKFVEVSRYHDRGLLSALQGFYILLGSIRNCIG